MADIGYLRTLAKGIPDATTQRIFIQAMEHLTSAPGISLGVVEHQRRTSNLKAVFEVSTTAASTGGFSIVHGLDSSPKYAIPVLDLSQPGAQLVPLEVEHAADGRRIYLKTSAGSTNALFALLVEG
jgi:hypothetical protein